MAGMLRQLGGSIFGAQVGQALGELAGEVVSSSDIGLPLGPAGQAILIPDNVAKFAEGLGLTDEDIRLYLALRECAHQRLFAGVPWLRQHLFAAVNDYASGIEVDSGKIERAMADVDMQNPEAMQEALAGGLFEPEDSEAQKAALVRLETALALVEGWVDDVVREATKDRMPAAVQLAETVRRRRAAGGPAEQTFATLVGLQLRPRRLRDAANLWAAVRDARGSRGATSCGRTRTCCRAPGTWTTRSGSPSTPESWLTSTSPTSCRKATVGSTTTATRRAPTTSEPA